jgi:uncharacterized membrane protein
MRDLSTMKKCSVGILVLAAAACSYSAGNNIAANDANAASANEAAPVAEENGAAGTSNAATPADNAATSAAAPAPAAAPYRASGTEPFWSLTLTDAQMVYDSADGADVTVATPAPQSTRAGPMYVTPQMTVRINQFQRCTEASGEEVHDTVTVTIGTQSVTGCGVGHPPR